MKKLKFGQNNKLIYLHGPLAWYPLDAPAPFKLYACLALTVYIIYNLDYILIECLNATFANIEMCRLQSTPPAAAPWATPLPVV